MALAQEDIEQIRSLIKTALSETPETVNANVRYELDIRERTIRVEEALKHQRELMLEGFKQMEKRFEQVDKRFEQVDKRFEQVDKRFEQVDKRFEQMQLNMDKRFEQVDKKFDQMHQEIMGLHQEIMGLHHEIKLLMRWSFGTLLAIGGLIVAVLRLAP
jgi:flagellar capping protein FliD